MRPDQLKRIKDLSEELADRFILEADPNEWPGAGVSPADWNQAQRGDAYWMKKNAMATGGVLRFTLDLLNREGNVSDDKMQQDTEQETDLDRSIKEAERRSSAAVKRAIERAQKASKV